MPGKIHGGVKNADDLQRRVVDAKEDDVAALRGDLAPGEKVRTFTELTRLVKNLFESGPEGVQVDFFLARAPCLECIGADGLKVCDSGGGELQGHRG